MLKVNTSSLRRCTLPYIVIEVPTSISNSHVLFDIHLTRMGVFSSFMYKDFPRFLRVNVSREDP